MEAAGAEYLLHHHPSWAAAAVVVAEERELVEDHLKVQVQTTVAAGCS